MSESGVIPPHGRLEHSAARALEGAIDQALFDDFCMRVSYRFGGEEYELGDSELGEPFILIRESDGKRFEVELEATVREAPVPP